MGSETRIMDIKGFEVTSKDDTCIELSHALGEEDRGRVEDPCCSIERIPALTKAYDKIIALDKNIGAVMACEVMGSEPMAIGWWEWSGVFEGFTEEKLEKLKEILIEAGFEIKGRIERDRFLSYG